VVRGREVNVLGEAKGSTPSEGSRRTLLKMEVGCTIRRHPSTNLGTGRVHMHRVCLRIQTTASVGNGLARQLTLAGAIAALHP
jgi:hypothetical protein